MHQQNHYRSLFFTFVFLLSVGCAVFAEIFTVTNTNDSGSGSLRQAITDADSHVGSDTICFNIPIFDPGFNGIVWQIAPITYLPTLFDDSTLILGNTQTEMFGDKNPDGPEIMLDGKNISDQTNCFSINSSGNMISGLIISGFHGNGVAILGEQATHNRIMGNYVGTNAAGTDTSKVEMGVQIQYGARNNWIGGTEPFQGNLISGCRSAGIYIFDADSNVVVGNIIGLDRTGTKALGNRHSGILISYAQGNRIGGSLTGEKNIISGNNWAGIYMSGDKSTRGNIIQGNFIGTDISGSYALENLNDGVVIGNGASANLVGGFLPDESNLISGHRGVGIYLYTSRTDSNQIIGNRIGTDITGNVAVPNQNSGICLYNGPQFNIIGPANIIRFNFDGIQVQGDSTRYNRITQNSIANNTRKGIILFNGNADIAAPSLWENISGVEGTTVPNGIVEIFSDSASQGRIYEDATSADENGNFSWSGTPTGPFLTATVTDPAGNTSEFSRAVQLTEIDGKQNIAHRTFFISQNYPNPFNPTTMIRFGIQSPCRVILIVYDVMGREVSKLIDAQYQPGEYDVLFNAIGLSSGLYFYKIEMGNFQSVRKMIVLE